MSYKYDPITRMLVKTKDEKMYKFEIHYGKGRPGGTKEIKEFKNVREAKEYAANHSKGWGFEVVPAKDNKTSDALPNWQYIMNDLRNIERHFDQARSNALKDLGSVKRDIDKILKNKDLPDDVRPMLVEEFDRLYKKIYG